MKLWSCGAVGFAVAAAAPAAGQASAEVVGAPAATAARQAPAGVAAAIERYLAPIRAAGQFSGTLLVARGDTVLYEGAVGWIDRPGGRPMTVATPIAVASITKPVTSVVMTRLIESGQLAAGDSVTKWIPGFPGGDRITVEHLASHRAGIPHRVTIADDEYQRRSIVEMVERIAAGPRLADPGARRSYSSMGYVVLARILELAGGRAYADLAHELVLGPAGATGSSDASRAAPPDRALPLIPAADGPTTRQPRDLSFLVGAGSLYSTPRDVFRIFRALRRGDFGVTARSRQLRDTTFWSGLSDGYRAVLSAEEPSRVAVVILANLNTGAFDLLLRDLPRIARGETVPPPVIPRPRPAAPSEAARRAIEGEYSFIADLWTPVVFTGPSAVSAGEYQLIATSDSTLFSVTDYLEVRVVRDSTGAVTGLRWGSLPVFPKRRRHSRRPSRRPAGQPIS